MSKFRIVLIVIAVIGILAYTQRTTILTRVMERGMETRMGANIIEYAFKN